MSMGFFAAGAMGSSAPPPSPWWGVPTYEMNGETVLLAQRIGWSFSVVGGNDLMCNRLRINSISSVTEIVMIHRNSDGALIASASIPATAGVWKSAAVTPFTIQNGVAYTISSRRGGNRDVRRNNTRTFDPRVSLIGNVFGTGDNIPTDSTANNYQFCDFGYE